MATGILENECIRLNYDQPYKFHSSYKRVTKSHFGQNVQGGSNMTGTNLYVNKPVTVPVIFEPPCNLKSIYRPM